MKEVLGIALGGILFTAFLKSVRPEWGTLLSLALSMAVLGYTVPYLKSGMAIMEELAGRVEGGFLTPLFRAVGAAILLELAADACKDAGENALAQKVEFFGKAMLLTMALPVIRALIELVIRLAYSV